jgi:tetratricopeptide (TPR) repeat protein
MENEPPSLPLPSAPYRGIEPFRFIDQPIFSASTEEVRKLVRLITIYRGIFFYGESGAGKSSLINAGLIPTLRGEGFVAERVRVQPIAGQELVIERIALTDEGTPPFLPSRFAASTDKDTPEPARVVLSVEEFVRCIGKPPTPQRQDGIATSGAVPVLFFDQFEELVTLFEEAPDSRERFNQASEIQGRLVEMLLRLLGDPSLSIKLVLSFREDYLGKVSRRLAAAPQLGEQAFRLSFPPETMLRKIIRGPFESTSIPAGHFTRRLSEPAFDALESAFRELSDTGTINLTEVQIACLALWENEEEEKAFLKETEHREAVRHLFGNYLDGALNRLEDKFRKPAITALTFLVTSSGTRNIVSEDDLLGNVVRDDQLTQSEACEVLKALSRTTRLVFRQTRGDTAFYEISSEFLIPWITEKRQARERDAQLEKQREEHERQQRELTQTQALLTEQRKRADDQAKAAKLQRRLTWAMVLVSVVAIVAAVFSLFLRNTAIQLKNKAVEARRMAVEQERAARSGALRVRKQNLDDKLIMVELAKRLAELTSQEETAKWLEFLAAALGDLREQDEAIRAYQRVIELEPQNVTAHVNLGYYYLVIGKADKALEESDVGLERDPTIWSAYITRGVALAGLGRYKEAAASIRKSIDMFHYAATDFSENELSPDIQRATGRTAIVTGERVIRAVTICELANLEAFAGGDEFTLRLAEADRKTQPVETYLIAVNWAWFHLKARPRDYGAFAAQGAWWEKAGFRPWAKRAYDQFQSKYSKSREPRYAKLAGWVSGRLKELKDERLPAEHLDAETLAFDAWDHEQRKELDAAQNCLDQVIKMEPDNGSFLLLRAVFGVRRAQACQDMRDWAGAEKFYKASKADCDAVLKVDRGSARAYKCRAIASQGLNAPKAEIEADFQKALEHEPSDGDVMINLSDLVKIDRPDDALRLLEQALRANISYANLPWIHSRMAAIQQAKGKLQDALRSIETAIAMKRDESQFYDSRAKIERAISGTTNESVVVQHLYEGYIQAGDTRVLFGQKADALSLYLGSIEQLAPLRKSKNNGDLDRDIAGAIAKISSVVESTASRAKAAEFWKTAIESGQWNEVRALFENEEKRLSTAK